MAEDALTRESKELLGQRADEVVVSAATIWEIEIKRAAGRLDAPPGLIAMVDEAGYDRLAVTFDHAVAAGRLPLHHRDPFDRMLVAQAMMEGLTLATSDPALDPYGVPIARVVRHER